MQIVLLLIYLLTVISGIGLCILIYCLTDHKLSLIVPVMNPSPKK